MRKTILFLILSFSLFSATTKTLTSKIQEIKLNEIISIEEFCEFTIVSNNFSKEIYPPNGYKEYKVLDPFMAYYECEDPEGIFLDIVIKVINLSEDYDEFSFYFDGELTYNNKYKYSSYIETFESSSGEYFRPPSNSFIDPLRSIFFHNIFELPLNISQEDKPLYLILTVKDKKYKYVIR